MVITLHKIIASDKNSGLLKAIYSVFTEQLFAAFDNRKHSNRN